jgi:hypothetical protein
MAIHSLQQFKLTYLSTRARNSKTMAITHAFSLAEEISRPCAAKHSKPLARKS